MCVPFAYMENVTFRRVFDLTEACWIYICMRVKFNWHFCPPLARSICQDNAQLSVALAARAAIYTRRARGCWIGFRRKYRVIDVDLQIFTVSINFRDLLFKFKPAWVDFCFAWCAES